MSPGCRGRIAVGSTRVGRMRVVIPEDRAGLLGVPKQRSQHAERDVAFAALQRVGGVEDVLAGYLTQVPVLMRPAQQQGPDGVEVAPGGFGAAGAGARAAVV